ncbi:MAG: hypothetical protein IK136_03930 [Oscillospiraceae bacterium]|nr:hypothetical protein [Oscillospiraceae bacterium]
MKAKKLLVLALAVILTATTAVSVSAAQVEESSPGGETEVIARVTGAAPGDVTYIITIPDVVDFGELTQPADSSADDYKDVAFTVTASEISGLDSEEQQISVYVKDQNATVEDPAFYLTNKSDSTKSFTYDMYNEEQQINDGGMTRAIGYFLTAFTTEGESIEGTLRLNQNQLCGYDLLDIVGDYSGYMVFYSTIETQ